MKQGFKGIHKAIKLLKMIHSLDQNIIPIYLLASVIKAMEPFVLIVGSSYIIDSLILKLWKQALHQTAGMLMINL